MFLLGKGQGRRPHPLHGHLTTQPHLSSREAANTSYIVATCPVRSLTLPPGSSPRFCSRVLPSDQGSSGSRMRVERDQAAEDVGQSPGGWRRALGSVATPEMATTPLRCLIMGTLRRAETGDILHRQNIDPRTSLLTCWHKRMEALCASFDSVRGTVPYTRGVLGVSGAVVV